MTRKLQEPLTGWQNNYTVMNSGSDGAQRLMYCANRIGKSLKDMPYHQSDRALFDEVRQIQAE